MKGVQYTSINTLSGRCACMLGEMLTVAACILHGKSFSKIFRLLFHLPGPLFSFPRLRLNLSWCILQDSNLKTTLIRNLGYQCKEFTSKHPLRIDLTLNGWIREQSTNRFTSHSSCVLCQRQLVIFKTSRQGENGSRSTKQCMLTLTYTDAASYKPTPGVVTIEAIRAIQTLSKKNNDVQRKSLF